MIDLRSDTVTHPSAAMREAMARAEVGDDVYGEDPTVNRLEELGAELLGKEAALFVASGTMGNLVALLTHGARGDEVIVGDEAHIYHYEQGGASALGGMVYHPVATAANGELPLDALAQAIRDPSDTHAAAPGIICLENTHNRCGGRVLSLHYMQQVRALADQARVPVHLDGARLANAAVALKVPMREITQHVTTVQLDLSKGLAAPVGGVVAGPRAFITRARRNRKVVGGGMRQAGVLAAAGILGLTEMHARLEEDHVLAQVLAQGLANIAMIDLDPRTVETNIVIFRFRDSAWTPQRFAAVLREHGVLVSGFGSDRVRMVTHYGIGQHEIEIALAATRQVLVA